MLWGCMGWDGVKRLTEVQGRMNADQYVKILEKNLLSSMEEFEIPTENLIFQQDNDPKHTFKTAQNWMEDNNISLLDWPPQSPDIPHSYFLDQHGRNK